MKYKILTLLIVMLCANAVHAITLQQAKTQGLVGERSDGYLGYVVKPPSSEVKELVKSVNNKRKNKFSGTAKNNGISVSKVGSVFHQKAVSATKKGNYYQSGSGSWVQK